MIRHTIVLLAATSFVFACSGGTTTGDGGDPMTDGGGGGTAGDYSCIFANSMNCMDYTGTAYRDSRRKDVEKTACNASGGTFQDGMSCKTAGRVGVCVQAEGTSTERRKSYYGTLANAMSDCMIGMGGRFIPG